MLFYITSSIIEMFLAMVYKKERNLEIALDVLEIIIKK